MKFTKDWRKHVGEIEQHVRTWKPRGPFNWPDDGLAGRRWHYWFHAEWVGAWNRSGRQVPAVEFILSFIANPPAKPPRSFYE